MGVTLAHTSLFHGEQHSKDKGYLKHLDSDDLMEWRNVSKVVHGSIIPLPIGLPMRVMYTLDSGRKTTIRGGYLPYSIEWDSLSCLYDGAAQFLTRKGLKDAPFPTKPLTSEVISEIISDRHSFPWKVKIPDAISEFLGRELPEEFEVAYTSDHPRRIWVYFVVTSGISPVRKETFASHRRAGESHLRWEDGETYDPMELPCWNKGLPQSTLADWLTKRFQLYVYDTILMRLKSDLSTHFSEWTPFTVTEAMGATLYAQYGGSCISYPVDLASIVSIKWFCQKHAPVNRIGHKVLLSNPNALGTRNLLWAGSWFRPNFKVAVEDNTALLLHQPARHIQFA